MVCDIEQYKVTTPFYIISLQFRNSISRAKDGARHHLPDIQLRRPSLEKQNTTLIHLAVNNDT